MELFLEILKFAIPALIVFATAYQLMKQMLDERMRIAAQALKQETVKITLPMRLQAYERLALLCDRAAIPNVVLRVNMPGMKVRELQAALMIAIQQEFDHNVSQQLYVSDTLWKILRAARQDTLTRVALAAERFDPDEPASLLAEALLREADERDGQLSSLETAAMAIRTEASQLF
mgnify:FL=1